MNNNIYTLFESRFPENPDRPFLEYGTRFYTYGDLQSQVNSYAGFLQRSGTRPGDRILAQIDKSPQGLFLYLACLKSGLIHLPLNTAYQREEISYFVNDAEPSICICDPAVEQDYTQIIEIAGLSCDILTLDNSNRGTLVDAIGEPDGLPVVTVQCGADDTGVIIYTSGTTGQPKGAMITHGNLSSNSLVLSEAWGWTPNDVMLHTLPIFHVHGLFLGCHLPLLLGGKIIFEEKFDIERVIDHLSSATVYMGVPTHYTRLLSSGRLNGATCANMRLFTSGSAPLLAQTFEDFRRQTGHTILERYGMTETGMNTSNPLNGARKPGTVGPALAGVTIRIVDDEGRVVPANQTGNLQVRGDNVFSGYWRKPEKTLAEFTADGFFKTGDLAQIDEDHYVAIVGRSKDLIITGGLNVYPKEIEACIDQIEGVEESAVIGIPDADFGEAVTAIVVPDGRNPDLSEAGIITALRERLAHFKVSKSVHFLDELPRNAMGKVQKNILRERYGGDQADISA